MVDLDDFDQIDLEQMIREIPPTAEQRAEFDRMDWEIVCAVMGWPY